MFTEYSVCFVVVFVRNYNRLGNLGSYFIFCLHILFPRVHKLPNDINSFDEAWLLIDLFIIYCLKEWTTFSFNCRLCCCNIFYM